MSDQQLTGNDIKMAEQEEVRFRGGDDDCHCPDCQKESRQPVELEEGFARPIQSLKPAKTPASPGDDMLLF